MRNSVVILLFTAILVAPAAIAMDWRQSTYDDDNWNSGIAPLGFDLPDIQTTMISGRTTYYFRKLFFLPSTYDPAMTELRIIIQNGEGVIVSFRGFEAARSPWLPSGDLSYDVTSTFTDPSGEQIFDLTELLFQCENSIGNNWRMMTVELHRTNPNLPMAFDAVISAKIDGIWQDIEPLGSSWSWYPESKKPVSTVEPVVNAVRYPLPGMPKITSPGKRIHIILDNSVDPDDTIFILSSPDFTQLLMDYELGQPDEQGQVIFFTLPVTILPSTYSLSLYTADTTGLPDAPMQNINISPVSIAVLPAADSSVSILHISDSHIPFRGIYSPNNTEYLQRIWNELPTLQPDIVIHTGDGYNEGNNRDEAELFKSMLDSCYSPVVYVGGNHELGEWCGDGTARKHYWDFFGWPRLDPRRMDHLSAQTRDFVIDVGDVSFVCIETWTTYSDFWDGFYPHNSVTVDQAQWIKRIAEERPDNMLIACYHHDFADTLESEILPWFDYDIGLSGHTHQHEEYHVGPVKYYKVGSVYQASRPTRWFHFDHGAVEGGDLMSSNPLEISIVPDVSIPAKARTVSIRNREASAIPGYKLKIPVMAGYEYTVTGDSSPELTGQWEGACEKWVWVSNDLEPLDEIVFEVSAIETEFSCCQIVLEAEKPLFLAGESNTVKALLVNTCQANVIQPYIALETGGLYFFWPDWSQTPSVEHLYINSNDSVERTVLTLTWPEDLALLGETVNFLGIILDDDTGDIISPLAQLELIY